MLSQLAAVNANSSQGITHPELRGPDRGTGRFSPLGITTSGCQGTIGQRIGRGARGLADAGDEPIGKCQAWKRQTNLVVLWLRIWRLRV
ncbi:hypothetical protein H6F46_08075 [Limnothrix sp. FACHB-1083]|uniref:hypothetical protein n=1 Tax=unclassified Limnothrix TaxID=2632864 RepID=UPI00168063D1|nr:MULTISPECIES: hypothetical protein [unclassified Limnothrix]MBD2160650.1 hypothetical protein [Limnothrix sp. FACHB-1083]